MRLVQVSIPAGKRETVADVLEDEGVDYMLTDETSGREYTAIAYFPLPTAAVQPILDKLQEAGLGEDPHTVIIDAETDTSRQYEELEERFSEENAEPATISREEIRTQARDMTPEFPTFVAMTVISAVVATAGMLLDSPAVVVGSMVIAALSSLVLVLVNILSINLAGLAVLWYLDYGPKSWFELNQIRSVMVKRAGVLVVGIAVLSLFLGGVTYTTIQNATFQNQVQEDVDAVLDERPYENVEAFDVAFEQGRALPFDQTQMVVITVGRPPGEEYPALADRLERRIHQSTDQDVVVQVRFVEYDTVGS